MAKNWQRIKTVESKTVLSLINNLILIFQRQKFSTFEYALTPEVLL